MYYWGEPELSLKEGINSLKAVQKLLINTVGERDYSAQETCHLLPQLPMFGVILLSVYNPTALEIYAE